MGLPARAAALAGLVRTRRRGALWLLACDTDADGLAAAAVTAQALLRLGHRFVVRASRDKTEAHYRAMLEEAWDGLILLDKGTSHAALLDQEARRSGRLVLVVDHHNLPDGLDPRIGVLPPDPTALAAGAFLLNPRAVGLDGSRDASAATTAFALALALVGDVAMAWGATALCGAMGDWQHMPHWTGWNREVVERSQAAGALRLEPMPNLPGVTLAEALTHARPPLPGLDGELAAATAWLQRLGLPTEAEVEELPAEQRSALVSAMALLHLQHGTSDGEMARLVVPLEHHARLGTSLRHTFRIADACGRLGDPGTGIAFLMGDPTARPQANQWFATYKRQLGHALAVLRESPPEPRRACQVAWTQEAELTGMVAGIAMVHLVPKALPLCVLADRDDGLVQVSTRGLEGHVARGLDLGRACQEAARAVGHEGGGHPVAAGAVVAAGLVSRFLDQLDASLVQQGFLEAARAAA